jgi:hypothetical protein
MKIVPLAGVCVLGLVLAGGCSSGDSKGTNPSNAGGASNGTGGSSSKAGGAGSTGKPLPGVDCKASSTSEAQCSDGKDDDCDGFVDCLDPDCEGTSCGEADSGRSCLAGACLGVGDLPPLPRIDNLVSKVRGDTAIVDFSAVDKALDYRIYVLPAADKILVGDDGQVSVKDAVYRCGGAMPRDNRMVDAIMRFDHSLTPNIGGYTRKDEDNLLGYVFLTPKEDRETVYRVANPEHPGGFAWEYQNPPAKEYNGADYVVGTAARDALLEKGWRDDGIAFYVAKDGAKPIYRREFADKRLSVFYADGAEKTAFEGQGGEGGERFKVLAEPVDGSVPLYRIFYEWASDHDILAAGEANKARTLTQGNLPSTSLMWPGLKGETTLVIEALDAGCPWPGGFVGPVARPKGFDDIDNPTITIDDARLSTGEVFINGQYPDTHPKPIARSYVTVKPEPQPEMDWFESFETGSLDDVVKVAEDNVDTRIYRNDKISFEFDYGGSKNWYYGEILNQLGVGSSNTLGIVPLGANAKLASDKFLHVTMSVDMTSTFRRYPQIMITDTPVGTPENVEQTSFIPMIRRLGPVPQEHLPPGPYHTIIVQTFSGQPELQIEFCDLRGWGVSQQCPRANVYGFHAGESNDLGWTEPWQANPVIGEYLGMDRLVKMDVYATTDEVYVYIEDKPAGCAVLPAGRFPAGDVNINFGIAAYHIDADEYVTRENPRDEYWSRTSAIHTDRKLDDLGVKSGVTLPPWDTRIKCGSRYYGEQPG